MVIDVKAKLVLDGPMVELSNEEQALLMLILEHSEPVGARVAGRLLKSVGVELSEASLSRMLSRLDALELTRPIGNKGRTLTPQGTELIKQHARNLENSQHVQRALELRTVDEILDWLRARKLLEGEASYLAALRIQDEAIEILQNQVEEHERSIRAGTLVQDGTGMNFHRELASHINSPIFLALIETLSSTVMTSVEETLDIIVMNRGTEEDSLNEHQQILDAIRRRKPDEARALMHTHFERLEMDVKQYSNVEFMRLIALKQED